MIPSCAFYSAITSIQLCMKCCNVRAKKLYFSLWGCARNVNTGGFGSAFLVSHTIARYVGYRIISGLPFFTVRDKIVCKILMGK